MIEQAYIHVKCDECERSVPYPLSPDPNFPGQWSEENLVEYLENDGWQVKDKQGGIVKYICPKCI